MQTLLNTAAVSEMLGRLESLRPDSPRYWGKMDVAQMMAHLANTLELALGDRKPPRSLIGRLIGGAVKTRVLKGNAMRRNSPTDAAIRITDARDFAAEQARLRALLIRVEQGGRNAMTTHPHPFFGVLTPDEWGQLQHMHVNHHLEQFGA